LVWQNRHAEAETIYRQSIAIRRKLWGEEHPELANTLDNLALTLKEQNKLVEAETVVREALGMQRKLLGSEHPDVATSLYVLGLILESQGRLSEAEQVSRETLLLRRKLLPAQHWHLSDSVRLLAEVLEGQGKQVEADTLYYELFQIQRAGLKADDPRLAAVLAGRAHALLTRRRFSDAEPLLRECVAIREMKMPDDWLTFNARSMLGGSLLGQKKYAEAEPLLLSGYEGMKQCEGKVPEAGKLRIREALQRLVKLYQATARAEQAANWSGALTRWDGKTLKVASPRDLNTLAWLLATSNDPAARNGQAAVAYAEKGAAITNRRDPYMLDTLAAAYAEAGQFTNAVKVQKESIALMKEGQTKKEYESRLKLYESNKPYHETE